MAEEHWQPARLIPVSGITGADEAERRATSALLAVLTSVKEFSAALLRPLGAPAGSPSTFIEVPFLLGDATLRPDGVIQVTRAGRTWTCLLEVKTGDAELQQAQVESYLDVARDQGFDAVLTISTQIAWRSGGLPIRVDSRRSRKVALHHLSWAEVLTLATQQRIHRGVADPDQAWVLGELIRYLEHPRSGALDFHDMGGAWVPVREAIATGTLRLTSKGVDEVAERWDQLLRFAAMRLTRDLGSEAALLLSRRDAADPALRQADLREALCSHGQLAGTIRIPGAIGDLHVTADLRTGRIETALDVTAPGEGRATTRLSWLTRQLTEAPPALRVDVSFSGTRQTSSALLVDILASPSTVIPDNKRDVRAFRLQATTAMGTKRGVGRGSFIDSVLVAIEGFYDQVVQGLRPWSAKPPHMPSDAASAVEEAGINITPPPSDVLLVQRPVPEAEAPLEADVVEWDTARDRIDQERAVDASVAPLEDSAQGVEFTCPSGRRCHEDLHVPGRICPWAAPADDAGQPQVQ